MRCAHVLDVSGTGTAISRLGLSHTSQSPLRAHPTKVKIISLPGSYTEDSAPVQSATPTMTMVTPSSSPEMLSRGDQRGLDNVRSNDRIDSLKALLAYRMDLNLDGKVEPGRTQVALGGYSDVYSGYCKLGDGRVHKVAIKKFRVHIGKEGKAFEKILAKELYIWSKLDHPRILRLEGFYLEGGNYPHLISKWADNGSALAYVKEHEDADVLSMVIGIAEGIRYLHGNGIVHSDIKPENVLISESGEPLLCDFGVSRLLVASTTYQISSIAASGNGGTIHYMAKELFGSEPDACSEESDVWAFAMTVYALLTRQLPYQGTQYAAMFAIMEGKLPSWPQNSITWPDQLQAPRRLCESCWEEKSKRPSMEELVSALYEVRDTLKHGLSDSDSKDEPCLGLEDEKTVRIHPRQTKDGYELDESNRDSAVAVCFRNMGRIPGRIVLQTFDESLRAMYPDDIVEDGRPIERRFKHNAIVNFTITVGRITKNFSRVFVKDTTIDVDEYFV